MSIRTTSLPRFAGMRPLERRVLMEALMALHSKYVAMADDPDQNKTRCIDDLIDELLSKDKG